MAVKYSILADVELNTKTIKEQLRNSSKNLKMSVSLDGASQASKDLKDMNSSMVEASLTFQAANEIFHKSIEVISSMVEQVYKLDSAIIEFQKVSNLSNDSLDDYVAKLSKMGSAVARTGKPKRQAPVDGMVNQQQDSLEIQYGLRAYSTTMVA